MVVGALNTDYCAMALPFVRELRQGRYCFFDAAASSIFMPALNASGKLVVYLKLLTLPELGNRWILGTSRNTMLGRFEPGDRRSINITKVPEPETLGVALTRSDLRFSVC